MGRCFGRAWAYAAAGLLSFFSPTLTPALAQDSDEVIVDPDLSGATKAPAPTSAPAADADEVIADPELSGTERPTSAAPAEDYGWGAVLPPKEPDISAAAAASTEEDEYDPLANTGIGRLELLGQT